MYVKIDKKKFEINELNTFWEKFKSLKFVLEPMQDYVILMKKKSLSTYMYCQRVDVVMTDEDDVVLKVYQQLSSERIILPKRKVKKTPKKSKKIGRNDPCPCGSGRKYKQCCGK